MVGIVAISHSGKLAEGILEITEQMAKNAPVIAVGGTNDGRIGTDINRILNAINEVYSEDGVLIFYDLGSAMMNAEMAVEFLDEDKKSNIEIVDAAFVEGVISAAVYSNINMDKEFILDEMKKIKINKRD
ncbi:dihydroxyacetone kinase phosphoryl donor subunit DhaM [Miniphocaeibacter halophilus]|uniref:PTS-dependent dihydroxyacetone kinase phosphotransferase subunit DhaM n=1 Tax=Miniphocaeibacter halophilus TaxID=2931922 RepID=A0AC61MPU6_9FIRM|nr:dihydroxyacetone kinase phosphoryl donor subunit DhaM [Miniphocaeibacter halophilus]QQK07228.1 PTS-dependent dihydroxyacetone kinase phosphotransferase subunit DhaM [Miniphocaeibacter halophilus]